MDQISVILTSHRRPQNLAAQIQAVRNQSVRPARVCVWHNGHPATLGITLDTNALKEADDYVYCTHNYGVWPRFLHALNMDTPLVCVFDDDTIPGERWLENCLATYDQYGPAVLGTCGVRFEGGEREQRSYWGWKRPSVHHAEVDIVGHSWFFEKDLIRDLANFPRIGNTKCGEDYCLSAVAQIRRNWPTLVPPHPPSDKSLWGSTLGMELGMGTEALYLQPGANDDKSQVHSRLQELGWKPLSTRQESATT